MSWYSSVFRFPLRLAAAVALYLVFHFQLLLTYSLAGEVWSPLALLIPVIVLYVVYRRPILKVRHPILYQAVRFLYWSWVCLFLAASVILAGLVDAIILLPILIAAVAAVYFFSTKRLKWLSYLAFVGAVLAVVAREPALISDTGRFAFGSIMLITVGLLFATEDLQRITNWDFAVLVVLAPIIFLLFSFYRLPDQSTNQIDSAGQFLYSATDAGAPARIRSGEDLRFVIPDCAGELLLGGASRPGLEKLGEKTIVLNEEPTGDNLIPVCRGRQALLYGTRSGQIVFQPMEGETKTHPMDQPVLKVEFDQTRYRAFAMDRYKTVTVFSLPNLNSENKTVGGVNIDILFSPRENILYRSTCLDGLEALQPPNLYVFGVYKAPFSLGGTMALDQPHQRLYFSDWLGRAIHVLDSLDLKLVAKLPTDRGIRQLVYDESRELLFAGSYFRGDVLVYKPYQQSEPIRLHVGRRVRGLTLDEGRCLGVSAAGVFALDLAQLEERFSQ